MSTRSVFTTDDPDILAKWDDDQRRYREWHAAVGEWAERYPNHKAVTLRGGNGASLSGLEGPCPGPLWRRHPRYGHWIPRKRTKEEKALHAEVAALAVSELGDVEGMPKDVWSQMPHWYSHGTVTYAGRLFVTWPCDAEHIEASDTYDASRWRRCRLSEYHTAKEAHEEEAAARLEPRSEGS